MTDDFVFCSSQIEQDRNRIFFAETVPGVLEWPHSWPDGELSYRLNNLSPDFPGRQQIRAVTVALRAWQLRVSRIKFRRERNPTAHVDFNVISLETLRSMTKIGIGFRLHTFKTWLILR
jgi:hypothetical protein